LAFLCPFYHCDKSSIQTLTKGGKCEANVQEQMSTKLRIEFDGEDNRTFAIRGSRKDGNDRKHIQHHDHETNESNDMYIHTVETLYICIVSRTPCNDNKK